MLLLGLHNSEHAIPDCVPVAKLYNPNGTAVCEAWLAIVSLSAKLKHARKVCILPCA